MAWLTMTDPSGSVECGVFPNAYQRLGQPTLLLREGAFLVARGRLAHEETTGSKVWIDQLVPISGAGSHMRVLAPRLNTCEPESRWTERCQGVRNSTACCGNWHSSSRR